MIPAFLAITPGSGKTNQTFLRSHGAEVSALASGAAVTAERVPALLRADLELEPEKLPGRCSHRGDTHSSRRHPAGDSRPLPVQTAVPRRALPTHGARTVPAAADRAFQSHQRADVKGRGLLRRGTASASVHARGCRRTTEQLVTERRSFREVKNSQSRISFAEPEIKMTSTPAFRATEYRNT